MTGVSSKFSRIQRKPSLVVGASGFLGQRLLALLGDAGTGTYAHNPVPGAVQFDAVTQRLPEAFPDLGERFSHAFVPFGAIDMEGCARDYAATARINVDAVVQVLADLLEAGIKPVFVSTDYIFDGTRGYWTETDIAEPRMAYGAQKLEVENWLREREGDWLVARLSKIVSGDTSTHSMLGQWVNEIRAGKPMRCADDQFYSPAWVDDMAGAMLALGFSDAAGVYHIGGPERFSRIGLLSLLIKSIRAVDASVSVDLTPAKLHDFPFLEKRPLDTSFDISKLQSKIDWPFTPMAELCAEIAEAEFRQPSRTESC